MSGCTELHSSLCCFHALPRTCLSAYGSNRYPRSLNASPRQDVMRMLRVRCFSSHLTRSSPSLSVSPPPRIVSDLEDKRVVRRLFAHSHNSIDPLLSIKQNLLHNFTGTTTDLPLHPFLGDPDVGLKDVGDIIYRVDGDGSRLFSRGGSRDQPPASG